VEAVVVLGFAALAATFVVPLLTPDFSKARAHAQRSSCQQNLKQVSLGLLEYTQDYDEQFPLVKVNKVTHNVPPYTYPYGWADAIQPYLRNLQVLQCPSETHPPNRAKDAVQANFTDYWYNSHLPGLGLVDISHPATTVFAGDGNDGSDLTNARYSKSSFPSAWLNGAKSPLRRHLDGANYAWLDGHIKWYQPGQVKLTQLKK
ncbi:MAG: DUF1559 domain-containing protein, partial [Abitibacteriaceae bacterium]|nr:DUF1559 domain-containing protein [Abditibacteriaceae bacterium]